MKTEDLAKRIDHTNLDMNASEEDISKLCSEAKDYSFRAVCVRPEYVKFAYNKLGEIKANDVKVACVIGFPKEKGLAAEQIGNYEVREKLLETRKAVYEGAKEIDLVMNVGKFINKHDGHVFHEISNVVWNSKPSLVKVIIESCYLGKDDTERAYELIRRAGAGCIKTSTGYGAKGAEMEKVEWMKEYSEKLIADRLLIKASGGIKDCKTAVAMIEAGADILGTSSGIKICEEAKLMK